MSGQTRLVRPGRVRSAVLAAGLLCFSGGAIAAAGMITATVTPLETTVTYSTVGPNEQTFYVGYTVTFTNVTPNTINHVSFRGTASVTDPEETADYDSAEGWTCSVQPPTEPGNAVTVSCPLGSFAGGQSKGPFAVFFRSPVKDFGTPTPVDYVRFDGLIVQQEGFNGPPNTWSNSIYTVPRVNVLLGTTTPDNVKTAVPKSGATIFTGDGSDPSVGDPITTKVIIPPLPSFTTAKLFEQKQAVCLGFNNFVDCYSSEITIPGLFDPYLTIVLRQHASTFKPSDTMPNIENVVVRYDYFDSFNQPQNYLVGPCSSPTVPLAGGLPCIAGKTSTVTASNTSPVCTLTWVVRDHGNSKDTNHKEKHGEWVEVCTPVNLNLSGYFEWVIISRKNGGFNLF
jgi:hypothetical protein